MEVSKNTGALIWTPNRRALIRRTPAKRTPIPRSSHVYIHIYIYIYTCLQGSKRILYIYIYTYTQIYAYVYIYIHMYIFVFPGATQQPRLGGAAHDLQHYAGDGADATGPSDSGAAAKAFVRCPHLRCSGWLAVKDLTYNQ